MGGSGRVQQIREVPTLKNSTEITSMKRLLTQSLFIIHSLKDDNKGTVPGMTLTAQIPRTSHLLAPPDHADIYIGF